jgi:hypothetical protein
MEYYGIYCVHFISIIKIFNQVTQVVSDVGWETIHKCFKIPVAQNSQIKPLKFHFQLNNT